MNYDDDLVNEIAPYVLDALARKRFFQLLDDRLCPLDESQPPLQCRGTYALSTSILLESGFDEQAIADVLQVLAFRGACCDCEVLYNVAENSRLKAKYWKAQAASNPQA